MGDQTVTEGEETEITERERFWGSDQNEESAQFNAEFNENLWKRSLDVL